VTHVCNWHQKSRAGSHLVYPGTSGGKGKKAGGSFLWESRCEDCVCYGTTLKCNTQRAYPLGASALTGWVQFDSDYSDGDGASPLFSQGQHSVYLSQREELMDTANFESIACF
jgi:hypothetical protein